jgi:hypothetical protein
VLFDLWLHIVRLYRCDPCRNIRILLDDCDWLLREYPVHPDGRWHLYDDMLYTMCHNNDDHHDDYHHNHQHNHNNDAKLNNNHYNHNYNDADDHYHDHHNN